MKNCKRRAALALCVLCLLLSACGESFAPVRPESAQALPGPSASAPTESSVAYAKDEIHKAANSGDLEKVKAILDSGVDVDARDSFGGTALHAAMFQDDMEIVRTLIDHGFDVNAQGSSNGFTPLHDAVWADNLPAAKLLIERGADLSIRNKDGQTPAEKARTEGKQTVSILSKAFLENKLSACLTV